MHQPGLYWAAQPFGFIEESVTTHSTAKAYPERFVSFFKGIGSHFENWASVSRRKKKPGALGPGIPPIGCARRDSGAQGEGRDFAYGWEPEPGSESQISEVVSDRIFSFLIKSPGDPAPADISCSLVFVPKPHGGPGMLIGFGGAIDITEPIDDEWTFKFRVRSADAVDFFFRFDELHGEVGIASDADASFSIETGADEAGMPYVLGLGERTRIEFGRLALSGEIYVHRRRHKVHGDEERSCHRREERRRRLCFRKHAGG